MSAGDDCENEYKDVEMDENGEDESTMTVNHQMTTETKSVKIDHLMDQNLI